MKIEKLPTINELTDSIEMLNEGPSKAISMLPWILVFLIGTFVGWCFIGETEDYTKATGIVRPIEDITTVSNTFSGRVDVLQIKEGDYVNKGDLLISFDTEEYNQQRSMLDGQKKRIQYENEALLAYYSLIDENKTLFSGKEFDDEYNIKWEAFLHKIYDIKETYTNINNDIVQITVKNIFSNLEQLFEDKSNYNALEKSIITNTSMFNERSSYSLDFDDFCKQVDVYTKRIERKRNEYNTAKAIYDAGGLSLYELNSISDELNALIADYEIYKNQFIAKINTNIENTDKKILELATSINDMIRTNALSIDDIDKQIEQINMSIEESNIYAGSSGTINMNTDLALSDYVQGGTQIASIVPAVNKERKISIYIPSSDIGEISEGSLMHIRFAAFPYQQYGEYEGKILTISSDVRNIEGIGNYYAAECVLTSQVDLDLMAGMECEARIVTRKRKIIYWILDKLDFIDK